MRISAILLLLFLALSGGAVAQDYKKVPVMVLGAGEEDDSVGRQVLFELREAVRGARAMRLVDESFAGPYIGVSFTSMNLLRRSAAVSEKASTIAVILTFDSPELPHSGYLIGGYLQVCTSDITVNCARTLLAFLDEKIEIVRKKTPGLWKRLQ